MKNEIKSKSPGSKNIKSKSFSLNPDMLTRDDNAEQQDKFDNNLTNLLKKVFDCYNEKNNVELDKQSIIELENAAKVIVILTPQLEAMLESIEKKPKGSLKLNFTTSNFVNFFKRFDLNPLLDELTAIKGGADREIVLRNSGLVPYDENDDRTSTAARKRILWALLRSLGYMVAGFIVIYISYLTFNTAVTNLVGNDIWGVISTYLDTLNENTKEKYTQDLKCLFGNYGFFVYIQKTLIGHFGAIKNVLLDAARYNLENVSNLAGERCGFNFGIPSSNEYVNYALRKIGEFAIFKTDYVGTLISNIQCRRTIGLNEFAIIQNTFFTNVGYSWVLLYAGYGLIVAPVREIGVLLGNRETRTELLRLNNLVILKARNKIQRLLNNRRGEPELQRETQNGGVKQKKTNKNKSRKNKTRRIYSKM